MDLVLTATTVAVVLGRKKIERRGGRVLSLYEKNDLFLCFFFYPMRVPGCLLKNTRSVNKEKSKNKPSSFQIASYASIFRILVCF